MEQSGYKSDLDSVFGALADPTRRAILTKLTHGQATVGELAQPFEISQPAISRHLKVLENAGLIKRGTHRQTRPAQLNAEALATAVAWLEEFKSHWSDRFDQLDTLLAELQTKDNK